MIFWTKRRRVEAILAASLYETLETAEQQELDAALAKDARLRDEAESLARIQQVVRLDTPEFTGDLAPLLRARLTEAATPKPGGFRMRWVSVAAFSAVAATVLAISVVGLPVRDAIPNPVVAVKGAVQPASAVTEAISAATRLLASQNAAEAQAVLTQALAATPKDAAAGAAQEMLAELEFDEFHRYPEAYAAYERLRTAYPDTFMNSQDSIRRFNLLDEARRAEYAPMYALDAIRQHPGNAFEQCERLMAQYPDSMVALAAMNEMRSIVGDGDAFDGPARVLALERVRSRCSDPAAVAQVTLALGNACRDDLCDAHRAQDFYNQAAASGHYAVAARAQEALARLVVDAP